MPTKTEHIVESPEPGFAVPEIAFGRYFRNKIVDIIADCPDKIAVIDPVAEQQLLLSELDRFARHLAPTFVANGLEARDCVYFFGDNSIDYLVSMTALHYLGNCYAPGAPANGPFEVYDQATRLNAAALVVATPKLAVLHKILADQKRATELSRLKFILTIEETENHKADVDELKRLAPDVTVLSFRDLMAPDAKRKPLETIPYFPVDVHKDNCVITFTSGTTGLPKGAVHTNYSLIATFENFDRTTLLQECRDSTMLSMFPLGHISGTIFVPATLMSQMTLVLMPNISDDYGYVMTLIEKYNAQLLQMSQALAVGMAKTNYGREYDLSSLRSIFYGGTKFSKHDIETIVDNYHVKPYELYGATEMLLAVGEAADKPEEFIFGNLGRPLPNVQMKIVELATGASLPAHKEGEICFRGPNCFAGYFENEQGTKETIDEDGWYHSGDVGYYDHEGRLFITDRIKEMIKYKGWSIFPSEVEGFLLTHEDVFAACVVGVPHLTEISHVRAYVQRKEGGRVAEQELRDMVRANMGYQKRLNAGVVFIDTMPRTVIGKVDRAYFKNLVKTEQLVEPADKS